jgi:hypothetical protein
VVADRAEQQRVSVELILGGLVQPCRDQIRIQPGASPRLGGEQGSKLRTGQKKVVQREAGTVVGLPLMELDH